MEACHAFRNDQSTEVHEVAETLARRLGKSVLNGALVLGHYSSVYHTMEPINRLHSP